MRFIPLVALQLVLALFTLPSPVQAETTGLVAPSGVCEPERWDAVQLPCPHIVTKVAPPAQPPENPAAVSVDGPYLDAGVPKSASGNGTPGAGEKKTITHPTPIPPALVKAEGAGAVVPIPTADPAATHEISSDADFSLRRFVIAGLLLTGAALGLALALSQAGVVLLRRQRDA